MSESKKMSRKMRLAITSMTIGMYIAYVVLLFWYHPFVVSAKEGESIPGGVGNTVTVSSVTKMIGKDWIVEDRFTLVAADGWEILACYDDKKIQIGYTAWNPSTSDYNGINVVNIKDCTGYFINKKDGDILQSWTYSYEKGEFPALTYCATDRDDRTIAFEITGCKLFESTDAMKDYINTGSLDGLANPSIDMGLFDKNIGYLHDLQYEPLMYGETDENGVYESFDDCFIWSDYYPEYDDSYLVEVRASCQVETKKWFGLSKGTTYTSDVRNIANGIRYKDLEWTIGTDEERSIFADFINEHMPDNSSLSSFGAVGAYRYDTYYFRIYRWDETIKSYRYGMWVRLTHDGSVLMGSINNSIDAGYFDSNGNWVTDKDSSYGEGKPGSAIVGSGDNKDDAKADADKKRMILILAIIKLTYQIQVLWNFGIGSVNVLYLSGMESALFLNFSEECFHSFRLLCMVLSESVL